MSDAWFEVKEGTERRRVAIEKDPFTIGRRTGNDLRLDGADVSREHAVVVRNGDQYVLRDSKSRFGTFVNGAQITEKVLSNGNRVRLGQSGGVEVVFLCGEGIEHRLSGISSDPASQTSAGGDIRLVATLLEGLRALGSARVLDDVLALVIDSATELSGAERGFIMLADPDGRLEFKLARAKGRVTLSGRSFESGGKVSYETSVKIPEEVFRTGKPKVVLDLLDGDAAAAHVGTIALGIRHVFCVPLRLVHFIDRADSPPEEKRIGVLYLDSRERGALATQATQAGLETLANEAAVAIQNARLYREAMEKARMEHELNIAAEIQQSLLPPPAWSSDYFDAIGTSVPCRAIGGDFFEYLTMVDGSAAFVVADVSGKGAPAALLTAVTQGVLATQTSFGGGPAAALARVNEVLIRRAVGVAVHHDLLRGDVEGREAHLLQRRAQSAVPGERVHGAPPRDGRPDLRAVRAGHLRGGDRSTPAGRRARDVQRRRVGGAERGRRRVRRPADSRVRPPKRPGKPDQDPRMPVADGQGVHGRHGPERRPDGRRRPVRQPGVSRLRRFRLRPSGYGETSRGFSETRRAPGVGRERAPRPATARVGPRAASRSPAPHPAARRQRSEDSAR